MVARDRQGRQGRKGGAAADGTRLLAPERSEPGVRYPLVLVLHGAGERRRGEVLVDAPQIGELCWIIVASASGSR